jgi:hypothetical protein
MASDFTAAGQYSQRERFVFSLRIKLHAISEEYLLNILPPPGISDPDRKGNLSAKSIFSQRGKMETCLKERSRFVWDRHIGPTFGR